jgi:cytidylate kinase
MTSHKPGPLAVAIDGPAAAGKSTTAHAVARRLGLLYVDSGAMYRALALKLLREETAALDAVALELALDDILVRTTIDLAAGEAGETAILLDGEDVTRALRDERVGHLASLIAPLRAVRTYLVERQRELARDRGVVMEGRDIGTVVLPAAAVKIYLDADLETRAARRRRELEARGLPAPPDEIRALIVERDRRDVEREESPLRTAPDAVVIDTSGLTIEEQVERVIAEVERRAPAPGEPLSPASPASPALAPIPARTGFYAFSWWTARIMARLLFGLRVHGTEHLPARGGFILAANHVSFVDPPILGCSSPRRLAYLAKRELFQPPGLSHLIRALGAFPIHRQTLDRQALDTAKKVVAEGFGLLLFPEGTRIRTGELGQGRPGVSLLAAEAAVPIIPVYIGGTLRLGQAFLRRTPILVRFGEPLAPPPLGDGPEWRDELRAHTAGVMAAIVRLKAVGDPRARRHSAA